MELNKAIEKLKNKVENWNKCKKDIFSVGELYEEIDEENIAIDTVLNELDNRIPRKDIEEQIKQLDLIDEYEAPNGWEPEREYARDILKNLLNKE